ncbi:hypothetical protein [uncultured Nostoc sp.]|uniref:hypothetical protein n=1 Tax=uncultured Nostoc sp. TaxID=340711 RepID=UPI0035CC3326
MQLEDYFDFQRPHDIRLKSTRVEIETILYEYIHRARTPEEISNIYTSLTLEQVSLRDYSLLLAQQRSCKQLYS